LRWNFVGIKTSLARDIAIDVWVKCVSRAETVEWSLGFTPR
jgi:hypothetical protein